MKELFPYRTLFGDVRTNITRATVDGEPLARDRIDTQRREIHLADLERAGWTHAAFEFLVETPAAELAALVEEDADPKATVVAHCGPANARQAILLKPDKSTSTWAGRLELERPTWFGRIELRPIVTATVGSVSCRIIGEGGVWVVSLDDTPKPPVSGALTIKWEEFRAPSDDSLGVLRSYVREPFFLHLDPDAPVLYLNRGFEGLFALLQDRRRRPAPEHALHDETRGSIAAEVWLSLFNASVQSIETDDEGAPEWPTSDWQRTVLELLFDRMYPEKAPADALQEVVTSLAEPEGASAVQQLALPAVATHAGSTRLLRDAIRRIGTDLREERSD